MIKITKVVLDDLLLLQKLSIRSYKEAFYSLINHNDVDSYVDQVYELASLKAELTDPANDFYFLKAGDKLCGYLKLTLENDSLELSRIYMLNGFKGLGVGSFAVEKTEEIAQRNNLHKLVLGVLAINTPAISFYLHKGFVKYSETSVKIGHDSFKLLLMDKEI
ncbi:GNAT family N-acetyltransferase [Liquorilactobacillus capillatus]|uniref:N-acetyltransferase domain-containing protein n=1 Tax=Liquorilactobacillus capillatus DSM 19910 TaxID=1423731 RepID=A0A0R1M0M6_9LACO|nr:GNAT family N-acetyltransferase [Liquorilactobacillus capillatus]KRL01161.1 hypothetical protein FC81_GL001301 [Liquorilactobacillus capillatus DSM 19910]